jgi:FkbM family methyltransferase
LRPFSKKIYSIEPSTEHFEALKQNKEYNKWDNVEVFNMAIADRDGEMALNLDTHNRTCHSLTNDYQRGSEMVKVMRFDTFIKENNIEKVDFCKFDVEGGEDMILRSDSFINVADKFAAIEVEMHYPSWPQLVEHMLKIGFKARRLDCSAIVVLFYK